MSAPLHPASPEFITGARLRADDYDRLYAESVRDPEGFWARAAQRLDWMTAPTQIKDVSFLPEDFRIRWYADGELNLSVNCLDRHLATRGDKTAIVWEGDDPTDSRRISYRELHGMVCRFANALRNLGVKKGDRVTIYLPMIPEAAVAMLACARIGAIHSVVFGGFSPDSIANRIADCQSKLVITADEGLRGGKHVPLKTNVDEALKRDGTTCVETVIVVRRTGVAVPMQAPRDRWFDVLIEGQPETCEPERMNAEDPLFILYTSGSTGKPKGVLHTTGGYLVYVSYTHECVFDLRENDVFWCTADVGWVTGHSYVLYGPLCNGATTLMFEGVPNWPDTSRFWNVCDKHRVTIFYTAPTAIRALMRDGDAPVKKAKRDSIRLLGTVGEPINPEAWEWYWRVVGDERCPVVDTWWQTETGGILIAPLPAAIPQKPGSATKPFFGVRPAIVDTQGTVQEGATEGNLVLLDSWPSEYSATSRSSQGVNPSAADKVSPASSAMRSSSRVCATSSMHCRPRSADGRRSGSTAYPKCRREASAWARRSSPSMCTMPASARSMPAQTRIRLLLPEPLGPIKDQHAARLRSRGGSSGELETADGDQAECGERTKGRRAECDQHQADQRTRGRQHDQRNCDGCAQQPRARQRLRGQPRLSLRQYPETAMPCGG